MSVFSERLKELRKEKDLTQKEIANKLGVSRVAYTNWENGKREPNIERFVKLADYFNVNIDYVVGRKNHRK
ncbi:helix-turn-helix domain-containing protein [Lactococcus lactis]|uniref:helix-turn-helix domain-containing protein n=1 Tax=Lactococcus lactis TaxID=1358 RepID=UPI00071D31DF|nr:helix-turn-helix transcriptional regulator [Lactococcus lactis]KSU14876.1 transcriptional regulator Cro/CI family [Lactococcus lactis subsp. lactis]MBU7533024.1 helix-turn-helix transcriptional regulator [Lactococcus lactis]MCT0054820.1 XRE family transcriptional regulator [Lactococcus lactis subsp. lactis]